MKKFIIHILILFTLSINAQIVSVGLDMSNTLYGSDVNNPSLDAQLRFMSIESLGK